MKRRIVCFAIALMGTLPIAAQAAPPVNSLNKQPYVFFDRPDSALTFTTAGNPSTGTGAADILDVFAPGPVGNNRHDALLSGDGGATPQVFSIDDTYQFSTIVNLSASANSPNSHNTCARTAWARSNSGSISMA